MTMETPSDLPGEADGYKSWLLPDVSAASNIISSLDKEKKEKNNESIKSTDTVAAAESIESIESLDDIDVLDNPIPAISAEQLQEITEAAEKEGYDAGFKKGLSEGEAAGLLSGEEKSKKVMVEQSERLQHIIAALLIPIETEQKDIERFIVNTTCQLTQVIVERELRTESSQITSLVDELMALLPKAISHFSLSLNPQDIELVEHYLEHAFPSHSNQQTPSYHIIKDEHLLPGGCRLESQKTSIDASVETKMEQLFESFLQKQYAVTEDLVAGDHSEDDVIAEADTEISETKKSSEGAGADNDVVKEDVKDDDGSEKKGGSDKHEKDQPA